jgi:hypothetical protein
MSEGVEAWWARRQFSRGTDVPYPIGAYREAWAPYPTLIRQYHPEFNAGITLTQIPPAAEVLLLWQCEVGHLFAATPMEQRMRPRRERRRSSWCPECSLLAKPPRIRPAGEPRDRPASRTTTLCPKTPQLPAGTAFASECAPALSGQPGPGTPEPTDAAVRCLGCARLPRVKLNRNIQRKRARYCAATNPDGSSSTSQGR